MLCGIKKNGFPGNGELKRRVLDSSGYMFLWIWRVGVDWVFGDGHFATILSALPVEADG